MKESKNGFALIALLMVLGIIGILFALYYKKGSQGESSPAEQGKKAQEDLQETNQKLEDYQKQLNQN